MVPSEEAEAVQVRVLGGLELRSDAGPVRLGSPRQRALLTVLLVRAGRVVSVEALTEAVWGDDPPADPRNAIQTHVARLRDATGGELPLVTRSPGYALEVGPDEVDAIRFEQLVDEADASDDPAVSRELLDRALGLWRGRPYGEFADDLAGSEALRLEERRVEARAARARARLALGDTGGLIAELQAAVRDHPLREELVALLMRALARADRRADALATFRRYRERLGEETGLEPSDAVTALQERILRARGDDGQRPAAPSVGGPDRPSGTPPVATTSVVGRDTAIGDVLAMLRDGGLATLTGAGGIGKTRLAVEVADRVAREVAWVDLAPVAAGTAVAHVAAAAVGADLAGGRPPRAGLVDALQGRPVLLVLDNCEHLLADVAALVEQLRRRCPRLWILATSRERLAVDGEQVHPVAPLGTRGDAVGDGGDDAAGPAVELFLARAGDAAPGVDLSDQRDLVAEVCRELDGLPLAIELAAARVGALPLGDLAAALRAGHPAVGRRRGAHPRHRDLEAVVAWSYELLGDDEQQLFDRLSVFAGAFTVDDARAVCAPEAGRVRTAERLAALVESSMLVGPTGPVGRYRMLRTLRRVARARLADRGETGELADRHAAVLTRRAEQCRSAGPADVDRLRARIDDLREAHRRARTSGDVDGAARLSGALYRFANWTLQAEVLGWAEAALRLDGLDDHPEAPRVHAAASMAAWMRGELDTAGRRARRAVELGAGPDDPARAVAFEALGDVASFEGRLDDAREAWSEEVRLARLGDDPASETMGHGGVALALAYAGRIEPAVDRAARAARSARRAGPAARAFARYVEGECLAERDPERALAQAEEAVGLARRSGASFVEGIARVTVVSLRGRLGDPEEALAAYGELVGHWRRTGSRTQQWITLRNLAESLVRVEADEPAVTILAAADGADTAPPSYGTQARRLQQAERVARDRIGDAAWRAARRRGAAMGPEEVVEHALEVCGRLRGAV